MGVVVERVAVEDLKLADIDYEPDNKTSLDLEVHSLAQLYRDRADAENGFDELKNQWGWGGFTTRDLKRCQHIVRLIALTYNWWSLFVRLADPDHHREAITSRPLLLHGIARRTEHAGQTRLTVTSSHGRRREVVATLRRITGFFRGLTRSGLKSTPKISRLQPATVSVGLRVSTEDRVGRRGERRDTTRSLSGAQQHRVKRESLQHYLRDFRQPADRASASEQNQRSPFDELIRVLS